MSENNQNKPVRDRSEYMRVYYQAHREKLVGQSRAYRATHREQAMASVRKWQKAHSEQQREYLKKWKKANPEKVKAYNTTAWAKYYAKLKNAKTLARELGKW